MARRKDIERELAKAVHAMNEKIRYHQEKGVQWLPERESVREIKKRAATTRDLQKELNRVRSFGKADIQKKVKVSERLIVTDWEKKTTEKLYREMNYRREKQLKRYEDLDATSRGEKLGIKAGQLPDDRVAELRPKQLNWSSIRSRAELQEKVSLAKRQAADTYFNKKNETFKQNYIQALKKELGAKKTLGLRKALQKMNAADIVAKYYSDTEASIDFTYTDPVPQDLKLYEIKRVWGLPARLPKGADQAYMDMMELPENRG